MGRNKNERKAFSILDRFSAWVLVCHLLGSVDFCFVDFSIASMCLLVYCFTSSLLTQQ